MTQTFMRAALFLSLLLSSSGARALEPYFEVGVGAYSREVVEEDPRIEGFKFRGTADSTRLLVKAGLNIGQVLNLYAQGGGADLSIDEFDGYDGSLKGAYGGGLRLNLYRSPYRNRLTLFVEGSYLRYTTNDHVGIVMTCAAANGCPADDGIDRLRLSDETIRWNEYTVWLGAKGRYENMDLYGGIRLSQLDGNDRIRTAPDADFTTGFKTDPDIKEDDNLGLFFGTDLYLDRSGKTALNFEVSLIDQDSFRAALRRTF